MKTRFERWAERALRLWPAEARRRRGPELLDHLVHEAERKRSTSWVRRWAWSLAALGDLVMAGLRLRVRPAREGGRHWRRREGWTMGWFDDVVQAARGLRRSPRFVALVWITLGLGVGLNTALFSVVDRVLLRPLAYTNPDELVYVQAAREREDADHALVSGGDLKSIRDGVPGFAAVEGVANIRQNLTGAGLPRQVPVAWSSPGFLDMLGVRPVLGRLYGSADGPGTVVLSHELWQAQFGGADDVLGKGIQLDGHAHTIVGVLPATFRLRIPGRRGERRPQLWKNPDQNWQNGDIWNAQGPEFGMLQVVARLDAGTTIESADAALQGVVSGLHEAIPAYRDIGWRLSVSPLQERVVDGVRASLLLLSGAVALVLLIACANVANLLLVRSHARTRELAVRKALGAGRARMIRLLLVESLLLAVGGAVAGLLLAVPTLALLTRWAPAAVPMADSFTLDGRVAGFGLLLAAFTTLAVGVLPAVRASVTDPARSLGSARGVAGGRSNVRSALVVVQVALTLVLLVGAGLLVSSLARLHSVEPGFDASELFTYSVSIPGARYDWPDEAGAFYREVQERTAALPGVDAAGVVWPLPFSGARWGGDALTSVDEPEQARQADYYLATEEYFGTAGIALADGRLFADGDTSHVAIVSRAFAEDAWPGETVVGRSVLANPWGRGNQPFEIIGLVEDVRSLGLRDQPAPSLYFDARHWSWVDWEVDIVARTARAPGSLVPDLRQLVADLDSEIPVAEAQPALAHLRSDTAPVRFALGLLAVFAGAAGLLAFVGLYGVVAHTVAQRRREIGIRVALGSDGSAILRRFLSEGVRLAGAGVGLGLLLAWVSTRALDAWLFGIEARDPMTFAAVSAGVVAAALLATWVPARRAASVDPVDVLTAD
jgi:predicted permease